MEARMASSVGCGCSRRCLEWARFWERDPAGVEIVIGQRAKNGAWFGDVLDEEFVGEVGEQRAHRPWPQRKTANDVHCLHGGSSKTFASLFGRFLPARLR
jgi:hypothetical protein